MGRKKNTQVGANEREFGRSCLTSTQTEMGKTGHGCLALNEAKARAVYIKRDE